MMDLPPEMQERVVCSIIAAVKYEIPANILLAIAEKESGKPGQWVENSNGTHDVGNMQFNTAYLQDLSKYDITADHVANTGCYAYDLAAWRIRQHIQNDKGDIWTKATNYHSKTPAHNARYRADLIVKAVKWADWLEKTVSIVEIK
ncbi:transglycosylase SLT domain-containing protein [Nitrosomonas sp.]|uniref:transglycosylase SLT domain-containing protein n=1 Tax=Nitrosomonas sp. TaxID=42353 RepID=UPI002843A1C9|nr:transglycosylase SLT domain-containing protein [Nitrosomonas sp.]MDR4513611.1 transglycosylase SLT domain-containing protein [Nitrosomonas sp.]